MVGKKLRIERRYCFKQPAFVRLQGGNGSEVETVTENVLPTGFCCGVKRQLLWVHTYKYPCALLVAFRWKE